jgi:ferrochelatase
MSKPLDHPAIAPRKVGVLLLNLGTPEEPTPVAVRRYLKPFLSDQRVVSLPKWLWWPILNGIILPFRAKSSAKKYASIWTPKGSPLKFHTEEQTGLLQNRFGSSIDVRYAMTYGSPGIEDTINCMLNDGVDRLLVIPLFPQYAGASTGAALDKVFRCLLNIRALPSLRVRHTFHDQADYIQTLARHVRLYAKKSHHYLISFHGIPERSFHLGDPYHCLCQKTARLLAESLGLSSEEYTVSFQSRLGKARWLQPYTDHVLESLPKQGIRSVQVIAPSFISDCLETLEEINQEGRALFLSSGGQSFHYIPCLNTEDHAIDVLEKIIQGELYGWI